MDSDHEEFADVEETIEDIEEITELFPIRGSRVIKKRIDHHLHFSDGEFIRRFRLSKESYHHLLHEIQETIKPPTERNCAILATTRLLLTLRYFATGNMLRAVGDFCGVSVPSASQIVKLVAYAIASLRPKYVKMPEGNGIRKAQRDYYTVAKFPMVIGTIGCTHVQIQSPGGDQSEYFRNTKGYFSLNVQTISASNLKILDIVARWPGSTHDQTIFDNSQIKCRFEQGEFGNGILLGHSGYCNTNYLLTPLEAPKTDAGHLYNEAHTRTRNVVERQHELWKRRFQVLRLQMRVAIEKVQAIIVATAVIHNLCIDMNDHLPPEEDMVVENETIPVEKEDDDISVDKRVEIIQYFQNL